MTDTVNVPRVHLEEWARLLAEFADVDRLGLVTRDQMREVSARIEFWSERPAPPVDGAAPTPTPED